MRALAAASLLALACSSPAKEKPEAVRPDPAPPPEAPFDTAALDRWFDAELAPQLPAVVAGVVVGDELLWHRAAGARDGKGGPPPDRTSLFRIGSVTKVLTGIAVMRAVDQGALDLDAPVATLVPELEQRLAKVTLRHLVTHTSGIPSVGDGSAVYTAQKGPTEAEMLRSLDVPLEFTPGSKDSYSNAGMALAGVVAARARKTTYRELMAPVLTGLGMGGPWDRAAVPPDRHVAGRAPDGTPDPPTWILGAFEPAGGLWASLDDMTGLARFVHGGAGADAVLPAARRAQMFADDPLPGGHGVAWIAGGGAVGHTGSTSDYAASFIGSPERKRSVIVLASSGKAELTDCAAGAIFAAVIAGSAPPSCASAKEAAPEGEPLDAAAVDAAMDRLLAFLDRPTEGGARLAFSTAFLKDIPPAKLVEMTKPLVSGAGGCSRHEGAPAATAGRVTVHCARVKLTIEFALSKRPPHLLDGASVIGRE